MKKEVIFNHQNKTIKVINYSDIELALIFGSNKQFKDYKIIRLYDKSCI